MGKLFTDQEANLLEEIILNRRDVRGNRFLNNSIEDEKLERILYAGLHAPSVGFSQPWEFVLIKEMSTKERIKKTFIEANTTATEIFKDEKQKKYIQLKLEGIIEAPLNIAVFYKQSPEPVLGQASMKEVGLYSVVCAIQNMWLMARALNIGLGWVSILNPVEVKNILNAPEQNQLVAYLCLGYVDHFYTTPELEKLQWEKRKEKHQVVIYEKYIA